MKIPLTPIRFLHRAEKQFGRKLGVVDGDRQWTYAEYASRCRRLANLIRSFGLEPGGRVAYLAYNTHQLLEAYYGVILAEGVFLPLNIRLSRDDIRFVLNDSQAECLFLHRAFLPLIEEIRSGLTRVRHFVVLDDAEEEVPAWAEPDSYETLLDAQPDTLELDFMEVDEDSLAEMFYTSGTTSRPKGVMLTHRNLYLHAVEAPLLLTCSDADVQLHTIPLFHVNGWGTPQFLTAMGGTHVMLPKFDPEEVFQQIERHRVSLLALVPTMATALLHHPGRERFDVSSVRQITIGGAASSPRQIREMEEAFGCRCIAGYGLTETCPVLTLGLPKSVLALDGDSRHRLQAMAGYPIPGVEIKLVGGREEELPWDGSAEGELAVRGDMVMEGYWNRPEETAKAMAGGWFHTGDLATIDPDGYVQIVDRSKDIIISGGENISSIELENVLLAHPEVLECAVIPVPDDTWGEVPKALVVRKAGATASADELLEHCRGRLAGFKMPKSVVFYEELPKGGTGKILKRQLRERYWEAEEKRVH